MATSTDELTDRAIGSLVFAVFGAAWLSLWLACIKYLTTLTGSGILIGTLALLLTSAWVLRRAKQGPPTPWNPEVQARRQRQSRVFHWVNTGQWTALILLGWLLPRLGYKQDGIPAAVVVVGLHLFPLAHLFTYRLLCLTGAAMIVWALGCLLLGHQPALQAQTAMGAGLTYGPVPRTPCGGWCAVCGNHSAKNPATNSRLRAVFRSDSGTQSIITAGVQ